jgi:hypothetical protein
VLRQLPLDAVAQRTVCSFVNATTAPAVLKDVYALHPYVNLSWIVICMSRLGQYPRRLIILGIVSVNAIRLHENVVEYENVEFTDLLYRTG